MPFAGIVVAVLIALILVASLKGRRAAPLAPVGGAATEGMSVEPDAQAALVEDARRYVIRSWSFELARYEIRIEDVEMTTALDDVLVRTSSDLVVNGGFFDPEGKPVGLAVSEGVILSRLRPALSGGVFVISGDRARVEAAEKFSLEGASDDASPIHVALQCRPRLVVDHKPNVKSDDGKRAERTALCTRDDGARVDVVVVKGDDGESPGPSLFALAKNLATRGCESALNLDGGPSTGVAWREGAGVRLLAPRGPVRHAVSFRPRS